MNIKLLKDWRVLSGVIIAIFILILFWQKNKLEKKLENTKQWLRTSDAAKEWRKDIEAKAAKLNVDFETQLDSDLRYAMRSSEIFGFLI
jgi:hypothetical protein